MADDLGVDLRLAHPAGDQLGVLGAEVDDEDGLERGVDGRGCRAMASDCNEGRAPRMSAVRTTSACRFPRSSCDDGPVIVSWSLLAVAVVRGARSRRRPPLRRHPDRTAGHPRRRPLRDRVHQLPSRSPAAPPAATPTGSDRRARRDDRGVVLHRLAHRPCAPTTAARPPCPALDPRRLQVPTARRLRTRLGTGAFEQPVATTVPSDGGAELPASLGAGSWTRSLVGAPGASRPSSVAGRAATGRSITFQAWCIVAVVSPADLARPSLRPACSS